MRRYLATALAVAALAAIPTSAQAQVGFGVLAAFHDDADFGVGAFVDAPLPNLHENVEIMGDFTWFFPGDGGAFFGADVDVDYWEINGNLKYNFPLEGNDSFTPFALGGLNIARVSASASVAGFEGSASNTDIGLNVGGGLTFGGSQASLKPSVGAKLELGGGEGFVLFGSIAIGGGGS